MLRYLADEDLRRPVQRQLNKGENLHAVRRRLFFANQGHIRRRHPDEQLDQALCVTIVTNAIVLWNTIYLADAVAQLRAVGYQISDDAVAHLTPAQDDHINRYGTYAFNIDEELARTARRPLRPIP